VLDDLSYLQNYDFAKKEPGNLSDCCLTTQKLDEAKGES